MNLIPPAIVAFVPILAEAASEAAGQALPGWLGLAAQYGVMGIMLAWFMMRSEPRLRAIEAAIDRSSRAQLVLAMASPFLSQAGKEQVQAAIAEVDAAINARQNKG